MGKGLSGELSCPYDRSCFQHAKCVYFIYFLSKLGRSTEDIQNKINSSEDEFENSVDEILERGDAVESDRDGTDHEVSSSVKLSFCHVTPVRDD